jgi:hypothetical protein
MAPVEDEWKKGSAEMLILALLQAQPRHGYEIGKLIEVRSGGAALHWAHAWRFCLDARCPVSSTESARPILSAWAELRWFCSWWRLSLAICRHGARVASIR